MISMIAYTYRVYRNVKCTCESRNITQEKGLSYFISRQKSQLLNPISTVL